MNKFNIWDKVWCIINYNPIESIITSMFQKFDNIVYEVEYDWLRYDMYDYEVTKTKEELRLQLEQKIKEIQWILESIKW